MKLSSLKIRKIQDQESQCGHPSSSTPKRRIINLIIVDESGSMTFIYRQALDGMNRTIERIKSDALEVEDTQQFINLITFNSEHYKQHLRHCPAEKAQGLAPKEYQPGGSTPLYDAIGTAVSRLERHITENDAVLVTIITDGEENSSREYNAIAIKYMIQHLSQNGWIFTFIGANQDVILEAEKIGIRHSMAFETSPQGTQTMWAQENEARHKLYNRLKDKISLGSSMRSAMRDEYNDSDNFFEK